MQFSNIAISTAFVAAALSQAAPTFEKEHSLSSAKREPLNPAFLGGSLLGGLLGGSKEQQDAIAQAIPQLQSGEFPHLPAIKQNATSSNRTNGTSPITHPILPQTQDASQDQAQKRQFLTNPAQSGDVPVNPNAGHHPILPKRQGLKPSVNDYNNWLDLRPMVTQASKRYPIDAYIAEHQGIQYPPFTVGPSLQGRGSKTDIGGLVAAGLNLLNTLSPQSRDFDESVINEMVARKATAGGAAAILNILNPIISSLAPQSRGFDESEINELIARGSKPTVGGAAALLNILNPIISSLSPQQRGLNEDEAEVLARNLGDASIDIGKLLNLDVSARSDKTSLPKSSETLVLKSHL